MNARQPLAANMNNHARSSCSANSSNYVGFQVAHVSNNVVCKLKPHKYACLFVLDVCFNDATILSLYQSAARRALTRSSEIYQIETDWPPDWPPDWPRDLTD
jgi:hypothetical protein